MSDDSIQISSEDLVRVRWMDLKQASSSRVAGLISDHVLSDRIQSLIFDHNLIYVFWQAAATAVEARFTFEAAAAALRLAAERARICPTTIYNLDAVISGIILMTSRSNELKAQKSIIEFYLSKDKRSKYLNSALIRSLISAGDIDHAIQIYSENIINLPSKIAAKDQVYYSSIFGLQRELMAHHNFDDLSEFCGDDIVACRQLFVFQLAIKSHSKATNIKSHRTVYLINLERDRNRYIRASKLFDRIGIQVQRVEGILGSSIPPVIKNKLISAPMGNGEVGCFLSHVNAWEKVANSGAASLILEDDAAPLYEFNINQVMESIPTDADLVYVNTRSQNFLNETDVKCDESAFIELTEADRKKITQESIIGGDAYIVTAKGANLLLRIFDKSAISIPVDWFFVAAALGKEFKSDIFNEFRIQCVADVTSLPRLKVYIKSVPLVQSVDFDYSSIKSVNIPRQIL